MKAKTRRILRFLLERAKESATWRGLTLIATAAGAKLSPEHSEAIVLGGLLLAGVLGAAFPDRMERERPSAPPVSEGDPR